MQPSTGWLRNGLASSGSSPLQGMAFWHQLCSCLVATTTLATLCTGGKNMVGDRAVLRYAVLGLGLCCTALCYLVLHYAVLCLPPAVLCCAVLCCAVLCCAVLLLCISTIHGCKARCRCKRHRSPAATSSCRWHLGREGRTWQAPSGTVGHPDHCGYAEPFHTIQFGQSIRWGTAHQSWCT